MAFGLVVIASCRVAETSKGEDALKVCSGGAAVESRSYASADAKAHPGPLFTHDGKRLHRKGLAGGYWLPARRGWPLQSYLGSCDEEDSVAFQGVNDRLWLLPAGPDISWPTRIGLFGLSGVADTLGRRMGQELEFSYAMLFDLGGFDLIPSAGMRWKNQDLVNYYYGVRPSEARAGRPAYEGESAFDPFVRLAVRHQLTERWSLVAATQYEWLDSQPADSPFLDANHDASFMVGMLYSW